MFGRWAQLGRTAFLAAIVGGLVAGSLKSVCGATVASAPAPCRFHAGARPSETLAGRMDRDANADALLDLFDFSKPEMLHPPSAPEAGRRGCKPVAVARR